MAELPRPDAIDGQADPDFVPLFNWLAKPDRTRHRPRLSAVVLLAVWHVGLVAFELIEAGRGRETEPSPRSGGRGAAAAPANPPPGGRRPDGRVIGEA